MEAHEIEHSIRFANLQFQEVRVVHRYIARSVKPYKVNPVLQMYAGQLNKI